MPFVWKKSPKSFNTFPKLNKFSLSIKSMHQSLFVCCACIHCMCNSPESSDFVKYFSHYMTVYLSFLLIQMSKTLDNYNAPHVRM
jgi:hypothetical protein